MVTSKAWLALDYHLGGPYLLESNNKEFFNHMWGVGAGIINSRQRLWVGYYFDAVIDDIEDNVLLKGSGLKLSLGVEFQTKLSVNFEYSLQTYRDTNRKLVSADGETTTSIPTIEVSVLYISISSPIFLN